MSLFKTQEYKEVGILFYARGVETWTNSFDI